MTAKQAAFVREYLVDLNASAAARRAGYAPRSADAIGRENLRKPTIRAAIHEAQAEREQRAVISGERVLAELEAIALSDAHVRDRIRALELLGRHHALFTDRVEHSGQVQFHHLDEIDQAIAELNRQLAEAGEPA